MEAIIIAESFGGVFLATSLRNALVPEYDLFMATMHLQVATP
jgi:hypothetical protein